MNDFDARLTWSHISEPGDHAATLIAALGPAGALDALTSGELDHGPTASLAARWKERLGDLRPCPDGYITPEHPDWPEALNDLDEPPIGLWVRGATTVLSQPAISIVGCRAASAAGEQIATELASSLATSHVIVSGGALGIDAATHRGALTIGGYTIAALAGGVDVTYPRAHADLFEAITATGGALVSEQPPGSRPARHRFLARNRIIAAWGRATIVVEAAARSGALATARRAAELGREVGAVPGPVTCPQSVGTNQLLRDYGTCVRHAGDVRELLGPIRADPLPLTSPVDRLPGRPRRVYDILSTWMLRRAAEIAREAGLALAETEDDLALLERRGMATMVAGRWIRVEP